MSRAIQENYSKNIINAYRCNWIGNLILATAYKGTMNGKSFWLLSCGDTGLFTRLYGKSGNIVVKTKKKAVEILKECVKFEKEEHVYKTKNQDWQRVYR